MVLIKQGKRCTDTWTSAVGEEKIPATGPVIVSLEQWRAHRDELIARGSELGIQLSSSESPREIADDLSHFSLCALEFPKFTDGRAYSAARLLRERYGFGGELRAVGDVLLEQLHFMHRAGFDAFQFEGDDAETAWQIAQADIDVWYQPTADGRRTAMDLRRR